MLKGIQIDLEYFISSMNKFAISKNELKEAFQELQQVRSQCHSHFFILIIELPFFIDLSQIFFLVVEFVDL
jgi:hypothetical protein